MIEKIAKIEKTQLGIMKKKDLLHLAAELLQGRGWDYDDSDETVYCLNCLGEKYIHTDTCELKKFQDQFLLKYPDSSITFYR